MRGSSGGPCCHCFTVQTPCWRKGPPEKPVLCNACGSRYLVKGSLAGYFPGARRSATVRGEAQTGHNPTIVVTKGPRKPTVQTSAGSKRKEREIERQEAEVQPVYNECQELHYVYRPAWGPVLFSQATASDSSADVHHDEEPFAKDHYHYLDASSDEYQESAQDAGLLQTLAATTATGIAVPRPAMFHRRPRKQLRPVACSC